MNNQLKRKVYCSICHKAYVNLAKHLVSHKISAKAYRKEYGETSYKRVVIKKINDLFVSKRSQWLSGYRYTDETGEVKKGWRTNKLNRVVEEGQICHINDRYLNDSDISRHLDFKHVVGVFSPKKYTTYLCFDIDGKVGDRPHELAKPIAIDLIDELQQYFDRKDIHLVFSGNKGYHVWLFFNKSVVVQDVLSFARSMSSFNGGNLEVEIEYRPESDDGKAVKLPLGKHIGTQVFSCFLDKDTFEPVENSYEYLMRIEKVSPINFNIFTKDEKLMKIANKSSRSIKSEKKEEEFDYSTEGCNPEYIDQVYKNGLPRQGVRNYYIFLITILLKNKYSLTADEAIEELMKWTDREEKEGRTKDNAKKSASSIKATVKKVYDNDLNFIDDQKLNKFEESLIPFSTILMPKNNKRQIEYCKKLEECFEEVLKLGKLWSRRGFFFISTPYLVEKMNSTERTVQRYLEHLSKTFLIFRAIQGINNIEFYKEMCEAAKPFCAQIPEFKIWFENQSKPQKGYNSLYYCPLLCNTSLDKLPDISINKESYKKLSVYTVAKFTVASSEAEDVLFKHNILIDNKKRFSFGELRNHIKARRKIRKSWSKERKNQLEIAKDFIKMVEKTYGIN